MNDVELLDQAAQVVLATGERGAQRLGDVLNLADATAVEQQRNRGQRLLGASGRCPHDDSGISDPSCSLPCGRHVGRRRQLDVQRTEQAGLTDLGGRVGGQVDVAVELHGHQRMPALSLDLGDVPTLTSPTRTREFGWMLSTSGICAWIDERARPPALGARQRQRVQSRQSAAGQHRQPTRPRRSLRARPCLAS